MKKYIYTIIAFTLLLTACKSDIYDYSLPQVSTLDATNITTTSAVLQGNLISDVPQSYAWRAFEISTNNNFTDKIRVYVDDKPILLDKAGNDKFSYTITGLISSTQYYYRAVLSKTNSMSSDIYGNVVVFTTEEETTQPPQTEAKVTFKTNISSITSTTFIVTASCTVEGCTLVQFGSIIGDETCSTPTTSNNIGKYSLNKTNSFTVQWYMFEPSTNYYSRLFVIDTNNNIYYSDVTPFTTKDEPGGSLTVSDFVGTYTLTAYSPWESKTVTWTDVQILPYSNDTVVAVGFDDREELRAIGIFDKGQQLVRFESNWYFEAYQFDVDGTTCVAQFTPAYYSSAENKAYLIEDGGKFALGEICLKKSTGSSYSFVSCDGATFDNYYANGFIFNYYSISDWNFVGNSNVYVNAAMTRTSTTTNRSMPAKKIIIKNIKQYIKHENNDTQHHAAAYSTAQH